MRFRILFLAFIAQVSFVVPALAQIPATATGTPPFGSFGGGPDVINLANLNARIGVSITNKPGRGMPFNFLIAYDSSIWHVSGSINPGWGPVTGFGWSGSELKIGHLNSNGIQSRTPETCFGGKPGTKLTATYDWVYYDGFGTWHTFPTPSKAVTDGCTFGTTFIQGGGTATDGSGYTLTATGPNLNSLVTADGSLIVPPIDATSGASSIQDRNGNQISVNSSGVFTDTLGTTALTIAGSGTPSNPITYTYTAPSGASAAYTVKYSAFTVQTNFGCTGLSEYPATSNNLVAEIDLPDIATNPNDKYTFAYEQTPGFSASVTARLASVTLPTGGTISYSYSGGSNGINCSDGSPATLTRTTPDGTWTYARSLGTGAASTTTITDPQGNQTVLQFQGIYETQRQIYQGSSSSGTLLQTTNTCYNGAASPCTTTAITLPITEIAKTTSWASGQTSQTVSSYNTYGLTTEMDEYGYGSGAPGALVRKTTTTYASLGNNINDRPSQVSVYAAGATNPTSQTSYTYDQGSVTSTSGTPQHVSVSGSRGNATTTGYLVSGSTTVSTTATYYDTGTASVLTDSNNNQTMYTYGTSSCGNSFPTTISLPMSMSQSQTWNCNGGLIASKTDVNGQITSYSYDLMLRLTQTNFPDGGWNLTSYTGATQQDIYTAITSTTPSPSCTGCVHRQINLDSSGRENTKILVSDPEGQTTVATAYDSLGRPQKISNPYRSTNDPTYGFDTYSFDALSRTASVTHQDSNMVSTYYGSDIGSHGGAASQLCASGTYGLGYPTLTLNEAAMKHESWSDALGRTIEVDEPDASNNLTLATCHTYDVLNNLTQTVQGSQTRTYAYDALSRKTSETLPEAGTTNFYFTTSGGTLCSGNPNVVCRRTDARAITTTYSYDAMNRLTSKSYSDSTPTVSLYYDESSVTVGGTPYTLTNTKGHLSHTSAGSGPAITIHSYDTMGRVQDLWQCTPFNCSSASIWNTHYSHNLRGNLTSWKHPHGETITQTFSNAQRITQIASSLNDSTHPGTLAQNIKYAPAGTLNSLQNGCAGAGCTQELETYDYNNRLQPVRVQLGTSSNNNANACTVYDFYSSVANATSCAIPSQAESGNDGNKMGHYFQDSTNSSLGHSNSYTYDNIGRLSASAATGSATHNLTFSYDRYGNMTCVTNAQTNGLCPNYTFNSSTNQINNTGYQYDAAGNLTADGTGTGAHTYQWDAENRLKSIDNGSTATYTYNALSQRVERLVGGAYTEYVYQASGEDLGENNRTSWTIRVIPFLGHHLAHYQSGTPELTYFMHSTRIGSTSQVTDYSGSLAQDQLFYPWGQEWKMAGTAQEMRFASLAHRDMAETGLDPTRFRMFSSTQGRWLSKDPKKGCGGDPQQLNRYAYVRNNPTNLIDPRGTDCSQIENIYQPFLRQGCDIFDASCDPCESDPCSFDCPFVDTCGGCGGAPSLGPLPNPGPAPCSPLVASARDAVKCDGSTPNRYAITISSAQGGSQLADSQVVSVNTDNDLFIEFVGGYQKNEIIPNSYFQLFRAHKPVPGFPSFPTTGNIIWNVRYTCFGQGTGERTVTQAVACAN